MPIQDFIYRERWDELREVQVAACDVIFNSENNLLLSTGTASGKTEAAFLPTLTKLFEHPSSSVGILYISPLKALINDQFFRLNYLLKEGNVSVCKWHGDAPQFAKNQLIRNPKGVLQITPESLEALLINKRNTCIDLFKDLRFVIIDEVHYFMNSPRGIQLLCELERIQKLVGIIPRRIGLSATLGDYAIAENWLNSGTNVECSTPIVNGGKRSLGIAMERFERQFEEPQETIDPGDQEHFEYLYKNTLHKKAIIFANARSAVEYTIANIKKNAEDNHTKDVYRVHHGNISAVLRENTEKEMKSSEEPIITGATVTLELDISFRSMLIPLNRIMAGTCHVALTLIVFYGLRKKIAQKQFTFIAIACHFFLDFIGGMIIYQYDYKQTFWGFSWAIENEDAFMFIYISLVLICASLIIYLANKYFSKMEESESNQLSEEL